MGFFRLILCVWMLSASFFVNAEDKQVAFLTSKGSYFVAKVDAKNLKSATTSVSRMDYFITQQYLSKFSIANEKDVNLRQWMTLVSQLAFSGNVIAAQLLVNEIKVRYEDRTALTMLKRIVNESTLAVDDDELFMQSQAYIDAETSKLSQWPAVERECANVMIMASAYGDEIAYSYAKQCLSGYRYHKQAAQAGANVKAKIGALKKGLK